jgi:hypothetical protein
LNPLHRTLRRFLGLPTARFAVRSAPTEWLELSDGVRLATSVFRPRTAEPAPALLIRTPRATLPRTAPARLFARLVAESGFSVVLQQCRGRGESEGHFAPFENEVRDGGETLAWIAKQPFASSGDANHCGVLGFGYSGFAAWAALAAAPDRVAAIAVGFHGRDPYSRIYSGGALQLAATLRFALDCDERAMSDREIDLERGLRHRPLREADRVALRRNDLWQSWLDHPRRDDFWEERTPKLPERPPPALLLAGWYDAALTAQLSDHAALTRSAEASGGCAPELVIGPWAAGSDVRRRRRGQRRGVQLHAVIDFFDRKLLGGSQAASAVRVFTFGEERWREPSAWPPPAASKSTFYLRSARDDDSPIDDGALSPDAPGADEAPKLLRADPDDPVPSLGGMFAAAPGPVDQRGVEARSDVLCYASPPLAQALVVMGSARVQIHVSSSAANGDFAAKLVDVSETGEATIVCDGIVRARTNGDDEPGSETLRQLEIVLPAIARRFAAGHRIRLEIAASNFPRFDRNPQTSACPRDAEPLAFATAQIRVLHDAAHPSQLTLPATLDR